MFLFWEKRRSYLHEFFLISFFLIAAFRGDLGQDTWSYKDAYYSDYSFSMGLGFLIFLTKPFDNPDYLIYIVSFLQYFFLRRAIILNKSYWKCENDQYLCIDSDLVLLGLLTTSTFIFFGWNVIRQGISAYIILCFIIEKNKKYRYLYLILAVLMHYAALVFFIFPLYNRISYWCKILILLLAFFGGAIILRIIDINIPFLSISVSSILSEYTEFQGNENLLLKLLLHTLFVIILLFKRCESAFINLYFFSLTFFLLSYSSPETAKRYLMYASILMPFIWPHVISIYFERYEIQVRRILYLGLIVLASFYLLSHPSVLFNLYG